MTNTTINRAALPDGFDTWPADVQAKALWFLYANPGGRIFGPEPDGWSEDGKRATLTVKLRGKAGGKVRHPPA